MKIDPTIGKVRTFPVRLMMRPEPIEATIIPATIGSIRKPDCVGEAPCTICMYSGRIRIPPNIATPTTTLAAIVTAAARIRNSLGGIRAASPMARSMITNAAKPRAPTA